MTEVYRQMRDRIEANAALFTDAGHKAPTRIIIFNNQIKKESEELPLPVRPFVLWGHTDVNWTRRNGMKEGETTVFMDVVQDCYVEGNSKSDSEYAYLFLLEYSELFEQLFDGWNVPCRGVLAHSRTAPDHDHGNYIIHRLSFDMTVYKPAPVLV